MAERTIRKRNGRNSGSSNSVGEPTPINDGNVSVIDEPSTVEPDGTLNVPTIDDYDLGDGSDGTSTEFVDPTTASNSTDNDGRRRRTRSDAGTRRGSRTRRTNTTETTDSVANLLFSIHLGVGTILHSELFPISEDEAKELAKAVTKVTQLYDLPVIGERALAWTNLAMVAGKVYGPRVVAAKFRGKKKAEVVEISAKFEQPQSGAV